MALVEASGWREWAPRLPDQPIFYPVLNEEYATMIARDWNVPASGSGYVTRFRVLRSFLDGYEVHQVGGQTILEYWIPAEDLHEFNANIVGAGDEHFNRQARPVGGLPVLPPSCRPCDRQRRPSARHVHSSTLGQPVQIEFVAEFH
jgi:hypothetical protein